MNEAIKERLQGQGQKMGEAHFRFKTAKADLARFDAAARIAVKADGAKRTEAEKESVETDTKCLLAEAGLVSAEVAAMSRISQ